MLVGGRRYRAQWQTGLWRWGQRLHGGKKEVKRGKDAGKFVDFMMEFDSLLLVASDFSGR